MKSFGSHIHNIYFLGIGGIGMSALAHFFHLEGKRVSGYDKVESNITRGLAAKGMEIFYMMNEAQVQGQDLVIYTPAISRESLIIKTALAQGITVMKRSEALGEISKSYQTLAIAGTHGKTTTSAMLTHVLRACGCDCTAFLGGISNNLNGNFVKGKSQWLVVEADEFDRSFLTLKPEMAVINSLDADHLDIYGTQAEMEASYQQFADRADFLLIHHNLRNQLKGKKLKTFGISEGDYQAEIRSTEGWKTVFDFKSEKVAVEKLELHLPGTHNVLNMTAALGIALQVGVNTDKIRDAVASFSGIYRRFDVLYHSDRLTYIDDYAHHPTEIAAAIQTARAHFPERQLMVVFQPHLYSRTRDFAEGFAEALSQADEVLLMDIYPAREEPIKGISSETIMEMMDLEKAEIVRREKLPNRIIYNIETPAVLMSLGAGDIDRETEKLTELIKKLDYSTK